MTNELHMPLFCASASQLSPIVSVAVLENQHFRWRYKLYG